eukprot:COSAG01_NODE_32229_length_584_cov_1.659794_1_plen_50_part_10
MASFDAFSAACAKTPWEEDSKGDFMKLMVATHGQPVAGSTGWWGAATAGA